MCTFLVKAWQDKVSLHVGVRYDFVDTAMTNRTFKCCCSWSLPVIYVEMQDHPPFKSCSLDVLPSAVPIMVNTIIFPSIHSSYYTKLISAGRLFVGGNDASV
jgi:hypothetical protein